MALSDDAIVVSGIGLVTPLGIGADEAWRAFAALESGIRSPADPGPTDEQPPGPALRAGRAGYVRGFRAKSWITSAQLRRMDWCSRMAVAAARQAMSDARALPLAGERREETALVVGSCYGNQRETEQFLQRVFASGGGAAPPLIFPNLVLNAPAAYAAIELEVQGPNLTVSQGEASGEAALATAIDVLQAGAASLVCAGGVDEFGSVYLEALRDRRVLDPDSLPDEERERARAGRRGLRGGVVPGEGAAMLVIERAADARARGARCYAEIECARVVSVPAGPYGFPRDVDSAAERLLSIVEDDTPIDAVIGGADGSPARAALDRAVLRAVAGRQAQAPAYAPFRRLSGEWGAAGALGVAIAALAIDRRCLPDMPRSPGEALPRQASSREAPHGEEREPRRVLVVGAARSGVLAPVVLRQGNERSSTSRP